MASEIQELIENLRQAECRRHRESLRAIDILERNMLGSGASPEEKHPIPHRSEHVSDNGRQFPAQISNVDRVLRVLDSQKYLPLGDIMERTGLGEAQVRSALYARSVQPRIQKKKVKKRMAFRLALQCASSTQDRHENENPSFIEQVRAVLRSHHDGLTTGEVRRMLPHIRRTTITATLYQLRRKTEEAVYDESTHRYRLT